MKQILAKAIFILLGMGLLLPSVSTAVDKSIPPGKSKTIITLPGHRIPDGPGFTFPYRYPNQVNRFYCFGLQPWDAANNEIHGGTDIIPNYLPKVRFQQKVPLVAVADGRIDRIGQGETGDGCSSIVVLLGLNRFWYAIYVIEPQTLVDAEFERQLNAVMVTEGQRVKRGQTIANLLVGTVKPGSYPHLHFGFIYKNPADTWESMDFLNVARSDGTNLPPVSGPGSPWQPTDLGLPTTMYCPYVYANADARAVFDALPKLDTSGNTCTNLCAYGSINGKCGSAK